MKIYALKYKDEFVNFYTTEYDARGSHRWETEDLKPHLSIVTGEFVEDK